MVSPSFLSKSKYTADFLNIRFLEFYVKIKLKFLFYFFDQIIETNSLFNFSTVSCNSFFLALTTTWEMSLLIAHHDTLDDMTAYLLILSVASLKFLRRKLISNVDWTLSRVASSSGMTTLLMLLIEQSTNTEVDASILLTWVTSSEAKVIMLPRVNFCLLSEESIPMETQESVNTN